MLYGVSPEDLTFAPILATTDGDNTVVTNVGVKRIIVVSYAFAADAAGTLTIRTGAAGTIHAVFEFLANGGGAAFAGNLDSPAFRCTAGQSLNFNVSAAMDIQGHLGYVLA